MLIFFSATAAGDGLLIVNKIAGFIILDKSLLHWICNYE